MIAPLACIHWEGIRPLNPTNREAAVLPGSPASAPSAEERAEAVIGPFGRFIVDDCRLLFEPLTALTAPAAAQAMHVESVSWVNDDVTTLDQLVASGLTVGLNQTPASPINDANFIVTVEPAAAPDRKDDEASFYPGQEQNLLPATVLRGVTIVDSEINVDGQTINWQLPYETGSYLQRLTILALDDLILPGATVGLWARVRIKLLGQMMFATGTAGSLFLDGRAFGQLGVRADGTTPRIDLQLPSGDGERASDLDGWFYLAPALVIDSLAVAYAALTVVVDSNDNVTGVEAPGSTAMVNPTATAYFNYAAVTQTTLALALTGETGAGTVASIPSSVPIDVGDQSVTFPISVLSNPGAQTTLSFEITASITTAALSTSSQSASFTVTGVEPPVIIQ